VRIVADCEVVRIRTRTGRPRRAHDLIATVGGGRPITVRAQTYVLSAGAIASSWLLMRSGIAPGLPVGKRLSFNMGAYLTGDLDRKIDSYAGLQISHYARTEDFVLETWWNPPVAQAINMPGWFEDHFANMHRYDRMMAIGVLVGTEGDAEVKRALTGGPDVTFEPNGEDRRRLVAGLRCCASVLFGAGAKRVLANTWGKDEFVALDDAFDRFLARVARGDGYLALGTGHPQGGNAIGRSPSRSVVDPAFRVHGYENLHVCDASVFPTSITVNPQITIMALAHYAAPRIG
jgi:choline dehydrogenase-like flavoprotein